MAPTLNMFWDSSKYMIQRITSEGLTANRNEMCITLVERCSDYFLISGTMAHWYTVILPKTFFLASCNIGSSIIHIYRVSDNPTNPTIDRLAINSNIL